MVTVKKHGSETLRNPEPCGRAGMQQGLLTFLLKPHHGSVTTEETAGKSQPKENPTGWLPWNKKWRQTKGTLATGNPACDLELDSLALKPQLGELVLRGLRAQC